MNYSELQTAIAAWTGDSFTNSQVKDFIILAEAKFNRLLRAMNMEARATATLTGQYIALPVDFLHLRAIKIDESFLDPATPQFIRNMRVGSIAAKPQFYTLTDGQIQFAPIPDADYQVEIIYFGKIPALSDSNTTNWLIEEHPDLYLAQSVALAEVFGWNDSRAGGFAATAADIIQQINDQERSKRLGSMPLRMTRPSNAPRS